ncbi:hypothetical protein SpCBS45565_g03994 [Spizellomyces sp. 'palustris']|nr:hypothetical protein SpCBS45565_g03994 [Spizellomyces sp. 'palustris']
MSEATLASLIKRLEAATQRIEEVAGRNKSAEAAPSGPVSSVGSGGPSVTAFEDLIGGPLQVYVSGSAAIGGLVKEQAESLREAIQAQKALIQVAAASKKPDTPTLQELLKPTQAAITKITELREKNRASPFYNHLSTVSEGIPGLGWVVVEPAPAPFVGEMRDSAQFWANRVIKEYKDKDKSHVDWANSFVTFLTELQTYVKKHHTTGLSWNPRGGDAKSASAAAPAPVSRGGAPAPPPPPAVGVLPTSSQGGGPPTAALFSELNKEGLTSGLRKVDKSEMTHKNPELRASSLVKSGTGGAATAPTARHTAAPKAPPKLALEGNKWVVENQVNNNEIIIDQTELRHVVYIYNCQNCTIQIKGKVNAVTIDGSKKVGLLVENVVSAIDVVNTKSAQVQITGKAPTVVIDKTDGLQLYLSKETLDIEILTAKSSEMNVLVQGADGDYTEKPLSEQFKTTVRNGSLVTVPVEHKG